jgi:hypothetical protein
MTDLDPQLRAYFDTLVEQTRALRAEDIIHADPGRRYRRRRRGRVVAAIAIALAGLIGVAIVVLTGGSNGPVVSAGSSGTSRIYRDSANGFTLALPSGWRALRPASKTARPQALVEVLSPGRPPSGLATRCESSLAHGVTGARVWIGLLELRYPTPPLPPRPQSFTPQPGQYDPALAALGPITTLPGCPSPPTQMLFNFTDHQRKFQLELVAGPDAPGPRITQAYRILDSLRVATPGQLHRAPSPTVSIPTSLVPYIPPPPPQTVRIYILNSSGRPGAEATLAERLGSLGYSVIGSGTGTIPGRAFTNSAGQSVSITSCRVGFSGLGAATLARAAIGTATVYEPSPVLEGFIQSHGSDCLVIIGQAANH